MLQVARLAPTLLDDAKDRVAGYLNEQFNPDGGVRDRSGVSDLYYTVFGLEGLIALQAETPFDRTLAYLEAFGAGDALDLVHLCCLARGWACLPAKSLGEERRRELLANLERYRAPDGGFTPEPGGAGGTAYHSFLALGALQDLGASIESPDQLDAFLDGLEVAKGGYANDIRVPVATTPTTAAVVALKRSLGSRAPHRVGDWLLSQASSEGGFLAAPSAPMPDLLSTATALHALAGLERSVEPLREPCLDFVDTLWTGRAFCGTWADDEPDAEYTYYALLALGHLSL